LIDVTFTKLILYLLQTVVNEILNKMLY